MSVSVLLLGWIARGPDERDRTQPHTGLLVLLQDDSARGRARDEEKTSQLCVGDARCDERCPAQLCSEGEGGWREERYQQKKWS